MFVSEEQRKLLMVYDGCTVPLCPLGVSSFPPVSAWVTIVNHAKGHLVDMSLNMCCTILMNWWDEYTYKQQCFNYYPYEKSPLQNEQMDISKYLKTGAGFRMLWMLTAFLVKAFWSSWILMYLSSSQSVMAVLDVCLWGVSLLPHTPGFKSDSASYNR